MQFQQILAFLILIAGLALCWFGMQYANHQAMIKKLRPDEEIKQVRKFNTAKQEVKSKPDWFYVLVFVMGAVAAILCLFIHGAANTGKIFFWFLEGIGAGYITANILLRKKDPTVNSKPDKIKPLTVDFYLPLIMERLVMAVSAGLDLLPAMKVVVELSEKDEKMDPVTGYIKKVANMTEAGMPLSQSLKLMVNEVTSIPARHAFLHMSVAYEEGGGLLSSLRELSDSTQLAYQETIEEEIAKLPVKATVPLMLTFAGLIIFFLAYPFTQIVEMGGQLKINQPSSIGGKR